MSGSRWYPVEHRWYSQHSAMLGGALVVAAAVPLAGLPAGYSPRDAGPI